jgi:superfamily I DNA/RNA helicase
MTLFCVGDTDQLLYRFQGAKPELLTGGLDEWLPSIETVKLETNYRSQDEIIAKSQQLISYNYSSEGGPYPQEFIKNSTGIKGPGEAIQFQMYETAEHEALETANTINELIGITADCPVCHGSGLVDSETGNATTDHNINCAMDCPHCTTDHSAYSPGDFFIGARTRAQLGYLEGALVRAKIPFINIAGGSFWQSKHVADVIAYLRLAYNAKDKDALERVYNIPSAGHQYTWNDKAGKFRAGDYCPTRYLGKEFLAKIGYAMISIRLIRCYSAGMDGVIKPRKRIIPSMDLPKPKIYRNLFGC